MNRTFRIFLAAIAFVLVPALLYEGLHLPASALPVATAMWAPILVLLADAALFYLALGIWPLNAWERVGISLILPLLIAMASWAAMMGEVATKMPPLPGGD